MSDLSNFLMSYWVKKTSFTVAYATRADGDNFFYYDRS